MALNSSKFNEIYKDLQKHNYKDEYQKELVSKFIENYAKEKGISETDLHKLRNEVTTISFDVEKRLEKASTSKESLFNQLYSKCNGKIEKMKTDEDLKKKGITMESMDSSIVDLSDSEMKSLSDKFKLKGLKFNFNRLDAKVIINDKEQLKKEFLIQALEQGYSIRELKVPAKSIMKDAPDKINLFEYSAKSIYDFVRTLNKKTEKENINKDKVEKMILHQEKQKSPSNTKISGLNTNENSLFGEGGNDYISSGLNKNDEISATEINRKGAMNAQVDAKNKSNKESLVISKIESFVPYAEQDDRERELEEALGVKHGEMSLEEMEQLYSQMMMIGKIGPTKTDK